MIDPKPYNPLYRNESPMLRSSGWRASLPAGTQITTSGRCRFSFRDPPIDGLARQIHAERAPPVKERGRRDETQDDKGICQMRGNAFPLTGEVEVDETYIGGEDRNRHWNKKSRQVREAKGPQKLGEAIGYGKTGVIGAIARKGNVVAKVIGSMDAPTLAGFVRETVSSKVSLLATDENPAYNYVDRRMNHQAIKHSSGDYVRGNVHTQNIESFWSLIKRGVIGTYHHVSKDYLPLYLNESSWRFNNRKNSAMFADLIQSVGR